MVTARWMTETRLTSQRNARSLELLATEGEHASVNGEKVSSDQDKTFFAYQLLTPWKMSFNFSLIQGYGIPRLPTSVDVSGLLTGLLNPDIKKNITGQKEYLEKQLRKTFNESEIIQQSSGASTFGIDPANMRTILYVPASTAEEADHKVRRYTNSVSKILGSHQLRCGYKIRAIVKK